MKDLFQWVPWFRELAKAVGEGRREGLVERAKMVDWAGMKRAVLAEGEDKADPLTFFYHLASIAGGKPEKRGTVYASVAEVFGIESDFDYSREDGFIFPTPPGLQVRFNNTGADPRLLWQMFDRARGQDGTSYGADIAETFTRTLQIKGVGVPKLTQVLFLINPRAFLPFDAAAVLPLGIGTLKKPPAKMSWDEYVDEMGRIRAAFPGCQCYEINVIGYLWTSGQLPRKDSRWYQIGTGEDGWRDFRDNHWVHLGGQGDMERPEEGEYPMGEPKRGDVVLVRTGTQEGRGIGIVYRNDYGERPYRKDRIHVLWVNKKRAPLAGHMPTIGFSEAERASYEAFAKSPAYSPTLDLLQPEEKHILTLYGEFYRPLVARLRRRGVHPGVWKGRWRSFHTGYPGAVYGTGLDDGKAKVFLSFTGAGYEQRFRALRLHREEIDGKLKGTVMWFDESHRDGETTVLLERDGAPGLTDPEEDLDATRLWMVDTLLALRGAVQPHLDQVMRVAGGAPSAASLIQSLRDDGLLFSQETVANYILALQTKRFAILTGISGTGKTKIAKAVAQCFRPAGKTAVREIPDDAVGIDTMPYMFKTPRVMIPVEVAANLDLLGPGTPLADRQIKIRYPEGPTTLTYHRDERGATALLFRGKFKAWFRSNVKKGDRIWLRVREGDTLDADELEIGLSETKFVEQPLDNYEVVPVRPDWVDNRGLLGYLNPLTNEYSTTPFLDLLLRARKEEERAEAAGEKPHPFFVILDEMNLARVEHYFSDFLSALESGEDIPLHENKAIESGESKSGPQVPRQLKVPSNVLFTGTVNVDETTYMFSPKVLDRAFTIEFDQVDLKGFSEDTSGEDTSGLNLDGIQGSLDLLPSGGSEGNDWKPSREDWVTFSEETPGHHKALLRLHDILEAQHRHFGYRVANEIARFVNLAREQAPEADSDAATDAAFDLSLLQKVLPKFHGTQQELESLLEEIFQFAVHGGGHVPKKNRVVELDDWKVVKGRLVIRAKKPPAPSQTPSGNAGTDGDEADSDNAEAAATGTDSPAYPRTGAKVLRMLNRVRDRGFTSFIE